MARVNRVPQVLAVGTAVTPTYNAANATGSGNGNTFKNNGRVLLIVKNGDSNPTTMTVVANGKKADGIAVPNQTFTIAATSEREIWLAAKKFYNDGTGKTAIDWSNVTSVTFALIEMPTSPQ